MYTTHTKYCYISQFSNNHGIYSNFTYLLQNYSLILGISLYIVYYIIVSTCTHAVKYLNVLTRVLILRCPRAHHRSVWGAVSTITQLNSTLCAFRLLHLAGTIRSCQRHLVNHHRTQLREIIKGATNPGRYLSRPVGIYPGGYLSR